MLPGLVGYSVNEPVELVVVYHPATPDRTEAIANGDDSPVPYLRDSALLLQQMGASHVVYACNTAHHFLPRLPPLRIPIVDMIDAAVEAAAESGISSVGLLATTGTVDAELYQRALGRKRIEVVLLSPDEQERLVMEAIYGAHGVKAGVATGIGVGVGVGAGSATQLVDDAARRLVARGAEGIILGCTELPLVMKGTCLELDGRTIVLIDPADAVARRMRAMGGSHGIAGGMGPEATVAFLELMHAPVDFVQLQRDIVRATIDELGAARDQEHLGILCIASRDPVDAARRLARAGADFLVMTPGAASFCHQAEAATRLPVLAPGDGHDQSRRLAREVVLRAARRQAAATAGHADRAYWGRLARANAPSTLS